MAEGLRRIVARAGFLGRVSRDRRGRRQQEIEWLGGGDGCLAQRKQLGEAAHGIGRGQPGGGAAPAGDERQYFPLSLRGHLFEIGQARERNRSEERRVGKEWGSTCRSRWSADH